LRRSRSRRNRNRKLSRSAVFLLLAGIASALITCAVFLSFYPSSLSSDVTDSQRLEWKESAETNATDPSRGNIPVAEVPRVVYPYSVIPGGVRTPAELREVSAHDPAVGEHYAGFDFQRARVVNVQQARMVYLSYRIGDKIYWTTKKVSLHAGEKLITDGKITARTRCGNQVSALPQRKAFPQEPAIAEFDKPIGGGSPRVPFPENFHSALESLPGSGLGAPALGPTGPDVVAFGGSSPLGGSSSPLGGGFLPIGSPLVPGNGCNHSGNNGGSCSAAPGPGPTPGTPLVPVPEPGTLELGLAGLLAMILGWKVVSRRTGLPKFQK
jgi:hypothetical protein